ncbi:phosphotransferase family protein [Mycolicibacterium peregrinum]|uniref:phosphotransferase family protein n=1 Tax=Mycolicibacterium peregrinum TaxID=43304 RepID=UPI0006D8469B|nr:phosphotransferase family protein [Mycolicibacterium peregrinum]MCV7205643.1 phosphotransferase family protein [Mycolicibacterium peregrinum]ORW62557.1 aminoglycoside phosphotransferase [Mycolicibacterium peregrinum]
MTMATHQDNASTLSSDMLAWVEDVVGATVTAVDRRPGGGRREAWFVDVACADGSTLELFLRYDRTDPSASGDPFTLRREAAFFSAMAGSAVPVPHIYAVHPVEQAILSDRVAGEAWFSRLKDPDERVVVATDFMRILAALHGLDPERLQLDSERGPGTLPEFVAAEIDRWEAFYRTSEAAPDPLIEVGFAWLKANIPAAQGPVVIVHGDAGPGNFLYSGGRVCAVLDWELAHLGDPHDDLAWVSVRAVQEPFTDLVDRFDDYARFSGRPVDISRVRYYRVFAELRILVLSHRTIGHTDPLGEVGNALIYTALHRRLFGEAMADVLRIGLHQPADLDAPSTPRAWWYDAALTQIGQIIVPRSTDPFVILRSKGVARMVKYLREMDRLGGAAEAADLDDLTDLLGARPVSVAEGVAAVLDRFGSGAIDVNDVVRVLHRQTLREMQILRPAMGVLAERMFDPLERS